MRSGDRLLREALCRLLEDIPTFSVTGLRAGEVPPLPVGALRVSVIDDGDATPLPPSWRPSVRFTRIVLAEGGGQASGGEEVTVLVKPLRIAELLAALAAGAGGGRDDEARARCWRIGRSGMVFHEAGRRLYAGGREVALTERERAILYLLAAAAGAPLAPSTLLRRAWRYTAIPSPRSLETHIHRLRRKLGDAANAPELLVKSEGGYRLRCQTQT